MTFRLLILLILVSLFSACVKNPATGEHDFVMMSETEELAIGKQIFAQMRKNMILLPDDDPLAQYVSSVGLKVAATADRQDLFYKFHVVDDSTINAFALPGGFIFIHRGLINHMNSEAELAAVLGHEIGHVTARHSVQQMSKAKAYQTGLLITSMFVPIPQGATMFTNLMAMAIIQGYGREAEFESDELSIRYLTNAGYDPNATIGILKTLKRLDDIDTKERTDAGEKVEKYHGAFSTHPETQKRIEQAIAEAAAKQRSGLINRNALLAAINGYAYGDSAEQGAVVGRKFLHPDLGIQLEFGEEWLVKNSPQALQAVVRKQKVYFQLQLVELQKRRSVEEVLKRVYSSRTEVLDISSGTKNGMPYAHGRVKKSAPKVTYAMIDVHVFLQNSRAYVLTMWSDRDEFDKYRQNFAKIADSFRSYDKNRDGDIPRIKLYKWKAGDTWQKLASRNRKILGRFTADKLAALNGLEVSEVPSTGSIIKNVE